jgi:hypothetical protein
MFESSDVAASPSCPRCETDAPAAGARCPNCGFVFFDTAEPRALPRPSGRALAVAAGVATLALVAVLLATRDSPPAPPGPISAADAEQRLELQFSPVGDDDNAAVRCPRSIELGRVIRCEVRYSDGIARALLVHLAPSGELEADIPYPATLRR